MHSDFYCTIKLFLPITFAFNYRLLFSSTTQKQCTLKIPFCSSFVVHGGRMVTRRSNQFDFNGILAAVVHIDLHYKFVICKYVIKAQVDEVEHLTFMCSAVSSLTTKTRCSHCRNRQMQVYSYTRIDMTWMYWHKIFSGRASMQFMIISRLWCKHVSANKMRKRTV